VSKQSASFAYSNDASFTFQSCELSIKTCPPPRPFRPIFFPRVQANLFTRIHYQMLRAIYASSSASHFSTPLRETSAVWGLLESFLEDQSRLLSGQTALLRAYRAEPWLGLGVASVDAVSPGPHFPRLSLLPPDRPPPPPAPLSPTACFPRCLPRPLPPLGLAPGPVPPP
jgi:hypothetical protein